MKGKIIEKNKRQTQGITQKNPYKPQHPSITRGKTKMTKKITNNQQPKAQGIKAETTTKDRYNTKETAEESKDCCPKAGTHKQAQQSSLLALTIFQFSITSLLTKALLISVQ